jgi:hypothetical protein
MRRKIAVIVLCAAFLGVSACSGSDSGSDASRVTQTTASVAASTTVGSSVKPHAADTTWLCRPGSDDDPCTTDESITQIAGDGARNVEHPKPATNPKVDCFYVYPTVSTQDAAVASLTIDPEEIAVAKAQASRFSKVCRVFAPMYRQRTIPGIFGKQATDAESAYAYDDVKNAWEDYLANDNDGRGVILIGHSQGSFVLTELIADEIETDPASRKLLVSAMLLGGNVTVPDGKKVGGSFQHVPECTDDTQTGCVVAYSTFSGTPVEGAMFGKAKAGQQVICTNPAALGGGSAALHPAFVTGESLLGSVDLGDTDVDTPWVGYPGLFTGECRSNATHTWFQITAHRSGPDDTRPKLAEPLGPTWGLHLVDVNIAMDDLVALAGKQADAYLH